MNDHDDECTDLTEIKERLRQGKITPEDLKVLEKVVVEGEEAIKKLRAAVVE